VIGVETEVKLAVRSALEAMAKLSEAGFEVAVPRVFESNQLWDWPGETLRGSKRLLRLRRVGERFTVTYKGPPTVTGEPIKHKTREEIDAATPDGAAMAAILARLGLQPTLRYDKYRTELRQPGAPGVAMLDETPIGVFIELEGPGDWIDAAALAMGFGESAYITSSYATLYRAWCQAQRVEPGVGMVFPGGVIH
jgi:adenylate cyclase class 2